MSGSKLSVECELQNRKNQATYLLADNSLVKNRRGALSQLTDTSKQIITTG